MVSNHERCEESGGWAKMGVLTRLFSGVLERRGKDLRKEEGKGQYESSEKIPIIFQRWACVLWSAIFLFISGYMLAQFDHFTPIDNASNILTANAEILVTSFAITLGVTLLGIQFRAQSYTMFALMRQMKNPIVYGFIAIFVSLIIFVLTVVSSVPDENLGAYIPFVSLCTIFSMFYLAGYVYHMIYKLQPLEMMEDVTRRMHKIINESLGKIEKNKEDIKLTSMMNKMPYEDEIFAVWEQIMLRAVELDNITLFKNGLRALIENYKEIITDMEKYNRLDIVEQIEVNTIKMEKQMIELCDEIKNDLLNPEYKQLDVAREIIVSIIDESNNTYEIHERIVRHILEHKSGHANKIKLIIENRLKELYDMREKIREQMKIRRNGLIRMPHAHREINNYLDQKQKKLLSINQEAINSTAIQIGKLQNEYKKVREALDERHGNMCDLYEKIEIILAGNFKGYLVISSFYTLLDKQENIKPEVDLEFLNKHGLPNMYMRVRRFLKTQNWRIASREDIRIWMREFLDGEIIDMNNAHKRIMEIQYQENEYNGQDYTSNFLADQDKIYRERTNFKSYLSQVEEQIDHDTNKIPDELIAIMEKTRGKLSEVLGNEIPKDTLDFLYQQKIELKDIRADIKELNERHNKTRHIETTYRNITLESYDDFIKNLQKNRRVWFEMTVEMNKFFLQYVREVVLECVTHDRNTCCSIFFEMVSHDDIIPEKETMIDKHTTGMLDIWSMIMRHSIINGKEMIVEQGMDYIFKKMNRWYKLRHERWAKTLFHDKISVLSNTAMNNNNSAYLLQYLQALGEYNFPEYDGDIITSTEITSNYRAPRNNASIENLVPNVDLIKTQSRSVTISAPTDVWGIIMQHAYKNEDPSVFNAGINAIKNGLEMMITDAKHTIMINALSGLMDDIVERYSQTTNNKPYVGSITAHTPVSGTGSAIHPLWTKKSGKWDTPLRGQFSPIKDSWDRNCIFQFVRSFVTVYIHSRDLTYEWLFCDARLTKLWMTGMRAIINAGEIDVVKYCLEKIILCLRLLNGRRKKDRNAYAIAIDVADIKILEIHIAKLNDLTYLTNNDKQILNDIMKDLEVMSIKYLKVYLFHVVESKNIRNLCIFQIWKDGVSSFIHSEDNSATRIFRHINGTLDDFPSEMSYKGATYKEYCRFNELKNLLGQLSHVDTLNMKNFIAFSKEFKNLHFFNGFIKVDNASRYPPSEIQIILNNLYSIVNDRNSQLIIYCMNAMSRNLPPGAQQIEDRMMELTIMLERGNDVWKDIVPALEDAVSAIKGSMVS